METTAPPDVAAIPPPSRRRAAVSGMAAVALSLAVAELTVGLTGGRSLVVSLGDWVIDTVPSQVAKWAIDLFGVYDKLVLVLSIVAVALGLGTLVGIAARSRFWPAPVAFLAFGSAAFAAGLADPLGRPVPAAVAALVAAVVGLAALAFLLRSAGPVESSEDRRAFFRAAGAVVGLAVASAAVGRWLVQRMSMVAGRAEVVLPAAREPAATVPAGAQAAGAVPVITPNDEFYKIDTALTVPNVDLTTWTLQITGMVDRPYELTYDELLSLPMVERHITLSCVSNRVGGSLVGTAKWLGVRLEDVLDRARVSPEADQIVGRSVDGFTVGFPTAVARDGREALIAVGMNDEPLPFDHGFPARLVVAGLYGYVSATKWLSEIELTTWDAFDAYWIPRGWAKEGPIKTQSRIDVPASNQSVEAGRQTIAGVAWAPTRGIGRVEVQVDDGPWRDAELADAIGDDTWRQWSLPWDATPGLHRIVVRATDGTGETQTAIAADPRPDGATGHHGITVRVV